MKKVMPREEYCLGCQLCEIACSVEHSRSKHVVTAMKFEDPKPVSRTRVEIEGDAMLSLSCRHCDDAPCLTVCMGGALRRDPDGAVRHDPERCVGCWMCVMVCPYGALSRGADGSRNIAVKCDFCPDRSVPACVEACPNGALVLVEVSG